MSRRRLSPQQRNRQLSSSSSNNNNSSSSNSTTSVVMMMLATLGGLTAARWAFDKVLNNHQDDSTSDNASSLYPRRDESQATILVQGRPKHDSSSSHKSIAQQLSEMDAVAWECFVRDQRALLREQRHTHAAQLRALLRHELTQALQPAHGRAADFLDWYLSYPTTMQLWRVAAVSGGTFALRRRDSGQPGHMSLSTYVTQEVARHVAQKYEALVLRPAWTDPLIHRAMIKTLTKAHELYQEAVAELDHRVADFVSRESKVVTTPPTAIDNTFLPPQPHQVVLQLDWAAQLQKVDHVPHRYQKNSPEFSLGIIAASTATGKLLGGTAAGAATKALLAKTAAPFVTKAAAAGAGATVAAASGPLGAAAGAAVGVAVDATVNAGVALMQRDALEQDIHDALDATVLEWEEQVLWPELDRVQNEWFEDAASLLTTNNDNEKKEQEQ